MDGESTDFVWGVLDMVPITDFPDIRKRCAVHSVDSGSMMVIPREKGMVRFYIQLKEVPRDTATKTNSEYVGGKKDEKTASAGRIDRSKITPEMILKTAQDIMKPYKLEMSDLDWYTGYQIGQRVATEFHLKNRIFISGDACHTHSPKAGQGMNVSMADTYNLGWKLALVCKGLASPDILTTYESERMGVANNLIEFDHKLSRMFSGKPMIPSSENHSGVDMSEFQKFFRQGSKFASGTNVDYQKSVLVEKPGLEAYTVDYASKLPVGMRFHTTKIVGHADVKPVHMDDRLLSDGRFRILIFCGNALESSTKKTLEEIQKFLDSDDKFYHNYTPRNSFEDSVFDILTIYSSDRKQLELTDFPMFARPEDFKGRTDHWKLYAGIEDTYHEGKIDAYSHFGVDTNKGAIAVLRPDGYVAIVDAFEPETMNRIDEYFSKFMLVPPAIGAKDKSVNDQDRFLQPVLGA